MRDGIAVLHQLLHRDVRVEGAEEACGDIEPRDDDFLATVHVGREARIRVDRRVGRHVPAGAEIFGEHVLDELFEVEAVGKRHGAALVAARPLGQAQWAGSGVAAMRQRPSSHA